MAELVVLSVIEKAAIQKSLDAHMAQWLDVDRVASFSHSNNAGGRSMSMQLLSDSELKTKIDRLRNMLGLTPMFAGADQLTPYVPINF